MEITVCPQCLRPLMKMEEINEHLVEHTTKQLKEIHSRAAVVRMKRPLKRTPREIQISEEEKFLIKCQNCNQMRPIQEMTILEGAFCPECIISDGLE